MRSGTPERIISEDRPSPVTLPTSAAFRLGAAMAAVAVGSRGARPWFDGGLGTVIAWGPGRPDTVWVAATGQVRRWSFDAGQQTWVAAAPSADEPLPDVVRAALDAGG